MSSTTLLPPPPGATRAEVAPPHVGRALALLAVSLLMHGWILGGVQRAADDVPSVDERPARTVSAVLLAPPPPPPPPRAKPRAARAPGAPPAVKPAPPVVAELAPSPDAAVAPQPMEPAPSAQPQRVEPEPQAVEAPPQAVEPAPSPQSDTPAAPAAEPAPVLPAQRVDGTDLAAELAETGVPTDTLPARATYVYLTSGSEYKVLTGETSIAWSLAADGRYEARLTTIALGITVLELVSTGQVRRFGLAPERYTQKRFRRSAEAANFDWSARRVTFSTRSFERELREGIQDRLSFQFQLMVLAQRLPERFHAGAAVEFPVAGPDGVDIYAFLVGEEETIATELGAFAARKVERPRGVGGADSRIEVWLAPALQWLPVKLRFTDRRGQTTENLLLRIEDGAQSAQDPAR
jgi:hypothetical protein